jgi:hypothetical protein
MSDDPASVADAPLPVDVIANELRCQNRWSGGFGTRAELIVQALANRGYEVVPAGTADRLAAAERWKAEATEVINGWDRVHDVLGSPGEWGQLRSEAVVAEVLAIKTERDEAHAQLAATRSAYAWARAYAYAWGVGIPDVDEVLATAVQPPEEGPSDG